MQGISYKAVTIIQARDGGSEGMRSGQILDMQYFGGKANRIS